MEKVSHQQAIQQALEPAQTTKSGKYCISATEAVQGDYMLPEPVPEAVTCKYCGRRLEYYGLVNPVIPKRVIVWRSQPERCTCSKAQGFWKNWDVKEQERLAEEATQKAGKKKCGGTAD